MTESFRTRLLRWQFNWFPAFRRSGARITYIAADMKTLRLELPLNWKTKNYVGTIYGGCMYSAVDGILMVMLIELLERKVIVWDKSGSIRYRKPGRSTLSATFTVTDDDLREIRQRLETEETFDKSYRVDLIDADGDVCAEIDKLIHFRRKR
ncbi:MAG: DUF4442 domain-containing protein [Woeseiaceae bacterium]|nr:DUF4442 domain-containing protein [Woeseiaceae bacterium]